MRRLIACGAAVAMCGGGPAAAAQTTELAPRTDRMAGPVLAGDSAVWTERAGRGRVRVIRDGEEIGRVSVSPTLGRVWLAASGERIAVAVSRYINPQNLFFRVFVAGRDGRLGPPSRFIYGQPGSLTVTGRDVLLTTYTRSGQWPVLYRLERGRLRQDTNIPYGVGVVAATATTVLTSELGALVVRERGSGAELRRLAGAPLGLAFDPVGETFARVAGVERVGAHRRVIVRRVADGAVLFASPPASSIVSVDLRGDRVAWATRRRFLVSRIVL